MVEHLSRGHHRIVIVSGHPSDIEVAAIAAALERHRAHGAAFQSHRAPGAASSVVTTSRWARAARLEGCGHAPIDDPSGFSR